MSATIREANAIPQDVNRATGSVPGDPIAEMLAAQNAEDSPIERQPARLEFAEPGSYRFRTRPGHRQTSIKLRVYRETGDVDKDVAGRKKFQQWAAREFGGGDIRAGEKALKRDQEVLDRLGDYYITFRPVHGQMEAVFETKDPVIASYLRERIAEFPFIYEEVAPQTVLVNGVAVRVIPADEDARRAMAAAVAGE